ncbi:7678_t:CDS:2, partial [Racocetra persica]
YKKTEQERPLHSWQVSLKEILPDEESNINVMMLTYFLEYYSNNAMDNIGWMNVVSEIIPALYERKLVKKPSENSLKVFIPITQLVPRDARFRSYRDQVIFDFESSDIRMVPLIDFVTNRETPDPENKFMNVITRLFLPGRFTSIKIENYSPFIRVLRHIEDEGSFYNNPSMETIMNWMWHCSKNYW